MANDRTYREGRCKECGATFHTTRQDRDFCDNPKCRATWNNRRMQRGAMLYDCFMTMRNQRGLAKALGIWSVMCRLAQEWYGDDNRRQTWNHPQTVIDAKPYLKGQQNVILGGRMARR